MNFEPKYKLGQTLWWWDSQKKEGVKVVPDTYVIRLRGGDVTDFEYLFWKDGTEKGERHFGIFQESELFLTKGEAEGPHRIGESDGYIPMTSLAWNNTAALPMAPHPARDSFYNNCGLFFEWPGEWIRSRDKNAIIERFRSGKQMFCDGLDRDCERILKGLEEKK